MLQKGRVKWICLVGDAKKWKDENLELQVETKGALVTLIASRKQNLGSSFLIEFTWNEPNLTFAEVLHLAGVIPLPPYIKRASNDEDKINYQTIYAQKDGSVAAPTAGLHFTPNLLEKLSANNIEQSFVTLHVGAGTFMPVKSETLAGHEMHHEFIDVDIEIIQKLISNQYEKIVAVGTTSLRTLETLYWMGVKCSSLQEGSIEEISVHQWDAYELDQHISVKTSLESLLNWMQKNNLQRLITKTQLLIAPGYKLRIVDGIITNFHQPKSTLLLLIHSFVGDDWRNIYNYALNNQFRFLSYGDGSLLWKNEN
jgi:S-adenosylmethionine:tRNA ribosyltransferase-isomerase